MIAMTKYLGKTGLEALITKVRALIEKAGMEVLAIYDAFTYNKPKPDSERVYFVAREHGKKTV